MLKNTEEQGCFSQLLKSISTATKRPAIAFKLNINVTKLNIECHPRWRISKVCVTFHRHHKTFCTKFVDWEPGDHDLIDGHATINDVVSLQFKLYKKTNNSYRRKIWVVSVTQDNSVILASEKLDLMHYIDDESTDILLKLKCRHQSVQKCMINLNIYQSNLANYRYIGDYFNKNQIPNSLCHFTNVECLNKNEYPAEKDNRLFSESIDKLSEITKYKSSEHISDWKKLELLDWCNVALNNQMLSVEDLTLLQNDSNAMQQLIAHYYPRESKLNSTVENIVKSIGLSQVDIKLLTGQTRATLLEFIKSINNLRSKYLSNYYENGVLSALNRRLCRNSHVLDQKNCQFKFTQRTELEKLRKLSGVWIPDVFRLLHLSFGLKFRNYNTIVSEPTFTQTRKSVKCITPKFVVSADVKKLSDTVQSTSLEHNTDEFLKDATSHLNENQIRMEQLTIEQENVELNCRILKIKLNNLATVPKKKRKSILKQWLNLINDRSRIINQLHILSVECDEIRLREQCFRITERLRQIDSDVAVTSQQKSFETKELTNRLLQLVNKRNELIEILDEENKFLETPPIPKVNLYRHSMLPNSDKNCAIQ